MGMLSKPLFSLLSVYLEQLFSHPVRTKSITSCTLAASANYTAQVIGGQKPINRQSVLAYGLYGFIFGGTLPHFFYQCIERLFKQDLKYRRFFQFLSERLVFAPFYQLVSIYMLARFELNSHDVAVQNIKKLYWPLLKTNWTILSAAVLLNITFVPPMLRTITMSMVSFVWVIFIAHKRRRIAENLEKKDTDSKDVYE